MAGSKTGGIIEGVMPVKAVFLPVFSVSVLDSVKQTEEEIIVTCIGSSRELPLFC